MAYRQTYSYVEKGPRPLLARLTRSSDASSQAGAPDPAPDGYSEWISPIIYPSPPTTGQGIWAEAVAKARAFVSDLTLEEKVNITTGAQAFSGWTRASDSLTLSFCRCRTYGTLRWQYG